MNVVIFVVLGLVFLAVLRGCYAAGRSVGWHARGYFEESSDSELRDKIRRQVWSEALETIEQINAARAAGLLTSTGDFTQDVEALADLEIAKINRSHAVQQ